MTKVWNRDARETDGTVLSFNPGDDLDGQLNLIAPTGARTYNVVARNVAGDAQDRTLAFPSSFVLPNGISQLGTITLTPGQERVIQTQWTGTQFRVLNVTPSEAAYLPSPAADAVELLPLPLSITYLGPRTSSSNPGFSGGASWAGYTYLLPWYADRLVRVTEADDTVEAWGPAIGQGEAVGIAIDAGKIVTGSDNDRFYVIDITAETVEEFTVSTSGSFTHPYVITPGNGFAYLCPRTDAKIIKVDLATSTVTEFPIVVTNGNSFGQWKLASNGKIYTAPWNEPNWIVFDPSTDTFDTSIEPFIAPGTSSAWGNFVEVAGVLYAVPYDADYVTTVDIATGQRGALSVSGPFNDSFASAGHDASSGLLTMLPTNDVTQGVIVVDPSTGVGDTYGGLSAFGSINAADIIRGWKNTSQAWAKTAGDPKFYLCPWGVDRLITFDPVTKQAAAIVPDGDVVGSGPSHYGWNGWVVGSDGVSLYGVPHSSDAILKVTPGTSA